MKLSFFLNPFPDETLYSVIARYHLIQNYNSFRDTISDIFDRSFVSASIDLPSHLKAMADRLPWQHLNAEYLIRNHTLYPYYASFLPHERRIKLFNALAGDPPPSGPAILGAMASKIKLPRFLQFCPECVASDLATLGCAYWHRVHQLPGVIVCPLHQCGLRRSVVKRNNRRTRHEFVALEQALEQPTVLLEYDVAYQEKYIQIALESDYLLNELNPQNDLLDLRVKFHAHLRKIVWLSQSGRIKASTFEQIWREQYPKKFLCTLACGLDGLDDPASSLRPLISDSRGSITPIYSILISILAGTNFHHLLNHPEDDRSYESEENTQICRNNLCPEFLTGRSIRVEIRRGICLIIHCDQCGMTYSKLCDSPKNIRYIDRGSLWKGKLKELVGSGTYSLREVARQLHVDPNIVKIHAQKEGVLTPWKEIKGREKGESKKSHSKDEQRKQWTELRASNPSASKIKLRQLNPALWAWLYRNDIKWFSRRQPKRLLPKPTVRKDISWPERDQSLSRELIDCVRSIREQPGSPVRVTRAEIARQLGNGHIFSPNVIKHLPAFAELVGSLVESPAEYAERRIWWCAERFREEQYSPQRWELVRRAGLRNELAIQTRNILDQAMESLQEASSGNIHGRLE